jgi:hypothetical protein
VPLAVFRRAKAKIKIQALSQRHRIPISEQVTTGAVATDIICVQGLLGAVWPDSATGGVEALAVGDRDVGEAVAVAEGFGLVAAEVGDCGEDLLRSGGMLDLRSQGVVLELIE